MFAHRRTGERVENAVSEEVRGRAEECINVVKYNKTGENGRETWQRRCDVSASRGNVVMAQELCLCRFSWLERARAHQRFKAFECLKRCHVGRKGRGWTAVVDMTVDIEGIIPKRSRQTHFYEH